jgi:hypothetical protein
MKRLSTVVGIHHKTKGVCSRMAAPKVDGVEEIMQGVIRGRSRRRHSIMVAIHHRHRIRKRVSTLWSPDDEIGTLEEISGSNEALLMPFEVDGDERGVGDFMKDGDLEMDIPENVQKRNALRSDHSIVAILNLYFNTCSGARRTGTVSKYDYCHMHTRIAKALINGNRGIESEEMKVAAEQEWMQEVGLETTAMTQEQVGVALVGCCSARSRVVATRHA